VLLFRNFVQETEESHECLSQIRWGPDRNSNRGPPGNEYRVLPLCQLAQFLDVYLHTEKGECQTLLTAICLGRGLQQRRALVAIFITISCVYRYRNLKPFRALCVLSTLAFRISAFYPQIVFVCSMWFSQ
jgi:hypothetical protein